MKTEGIKATSISTLGGGRVGSSNNDCCCYYFIVAVKKKEKDTRQKSEAYKITRDNHDTPTTLLSFR